MSQWTHTLRPGMILTTAMGLWLLVSPAEAQMPMPATQPEDSASADERMFAVRPMLAESGSPQPCKMDVLLEVPVRPCFTPAVIEAQPRGLPVGLGPMAVRPAGEDVPPLAALPMVPAMRPLPARLPAWAPSADIEDLRLMWGRGRRGHDRVGAAADPAGEAGTRAVLRAAAGFRETAAAFLRLVVPDPFEAIVTLRLRQAVPDDEPPVSPPNLLPRPKLPSGP